jgi:hypothetical protein
MTEPESVKAGIGQDTDHHPPSCPGDRRSGSKVRWSDGM